MTVSYSRSVATVHYASLLRLLLRWRGSVYKAVWPVFLTYTCAYGIIALTYYTLPSDTLERREIKRRFVQVCAYAGHISNAIPLSFILGFFVNIVVGRWWQQFLNLPTPDAICVLMAAYLTEGSSRKTKTVQGQDEDRPLLFRRTIARYLNLASALCFYSFSLSMRRRVGSLEDLVFCGLMTKHELELYSGLSQGNCYFFIPLVWAITLLTRAYHEGMIRHERHLDSLVGEVVGYWRQLHAIFLHDYVNIPLVYNQVVTLAVYIYLSMLILSHQFVDPVHLLKQYEQEIKPSYQLVNVSANLTTTHVFEFTNQTTSTPDLQTTCLDVSPNIPVFALLSLVFYTGWLRVAETNVFPFGEDDDDFEVVPLLERNINTSLWFVDNNETEMPEILRPKDKQAPTDEPDMSKLLSIAAASNESMGWKRIAGSGDIIGTALLREGRSLRSVTNPPLSDQQSIPDLPCPEQLRRRSSKYFFTGSLARIYDGDPSELPYTLRHRQSSVLTRVSEHTLSSQMGNTLLYNEPTTVWGSVEKFFGDIRTRFSSVFLPRPSSSTHMVAGHDFDLSAEPDRMVGSGQSGADPQKSP
ncbi:bestrophin-3 [Paragonimus westermani]|uniref:Bestrophin homolog n=1 Tax=Paragonimus westermani TaxID=34504 RepID=A0A5J4NJJ4_9TREM|nr:bestrophin-3 [Paragonimus westermani]